VNKRIDYQNNGGFPATQFMTNWMQDSYRNALMALASFIGPMVILSGVDIAGNVVTNGWLAVNGEMVPFIGGALPDDPQIILVESSESRLFQDNVSHDVYFEKVARFGTPGQFTLNDLKRLGTIQAHFLNHENPHEVTLAQLGFTADDNPLSNLADHLASTVATKALADMIKVIGVGEFNIGDVPPGDPNWTINHDLNIQGNYIVVGSYRSNANYAANNKLPVPVFFNTQPNSFQISLQEISGEVQNINFVYAIIKL
jgi:hypothetical protein